MMSTCANANLKKNEEILVEYRVLQVKHPPYSLDLLAPCDFLLFTKLKINLSGKIYGCRGHWMKYNAIALHYIKRINLELLF